MANVLIETECELSVHGIGCLRTGITTAAALIAFAANSILCRMALGRSLIDPVGFTTIRLVSGALALLVILGLTRRGEAIRPLGSWISAALLFLYAAAFSFAYVSLSTGVGALILFGAVQATMIIAGISMGERPHLMVWCGIAIALAGLIYLVLPGFSAPPLTGAALMAAAGISWGIYSIRGRDTLHPVAVTGDNFLRTLPFALVFTLMLKRQLDLSLHGVLLALASGAITSGMGYVIWYAAIRNLSATQAASVQLLVPAIAALGGVLLLSEPITLRLVLASVMLFAGVGTTIVFRHR